MNKCDVCGELKDTVYKIKQDYICAECLEKTHDLTILTDCSTKVKKSLSPKEIKEHLDNYVVGQDRAKEILSVAIYNHYKMLKYKEENINNDDAIEIEKSNIMMVGPTGSGKSYLIKNLAKVMNVPYASADANTLTEAGFVGNDVECVIRSLLSAANGDVKLAEKGIVFIDEVDKLASAKKENMSITADPGRTGVQQALLKMIEGYEVEVTEKGQRKHPDAPVTRVDTTNILFIFGGAFVGLDKIIQKRINKKTSSLGFTSKLKDKEELSETLKQVTNDDLRDFGLIPEFIGRIPVTATLNELSEEDLVKILTEPKNAIVKQYKELLKLDNIELEFDEESLLEIAKLAVEKKTGARSLRSVIEPFITRISFDLANENNKNLRVKVTKDTIINNEDPIVEECA